MELVVAASRAFTVRLLLLTGSVFLESSSNVGQLDQSSTVCLIRPFVYYTEPPGHHPVSLTIPKLTLPNHLTTPWLLIPPLYTLTHPALLPHSSTQVPTHPINNVSRGPVSPMSDRCLIGGHATNHRPATTLPSAPVDRDRLR